MTATLIGYARCSTDKQDLAAQKAAFEQLGRADLLVPRDYRSCPVRWLPKVFETDVGGSSGTIMHNLWLWCVRQPVGLVLQPGLSVNLGG